MSKVREWDDIMVGRAHGDVLHVVPVNDLVAHETTTVCVCGPYTEPLGDADLLVVHHALDGRE